VDAGRRSVLILAGDPYVMRACEPHGIDAVVLCQAGGYDDGRLRVPASGILIRVDDITSPESCLAALHRAGLGKHKFDAIQTTWEFAVVTAAVLGLALGCRALDPTVALHFRDKSLQKARLRAAGIAVSRTVVVQDIYDTSQVELEFDRAVLKPIAGGGTTFTSVVRERKDLEAASRTARESKATDRTFLMEEFVEGDEWIAEGIVFGGEVLFVGLGTYSEPCLDAMTGQVPVSLRRLDPVGEADSYALAEPVVRAAISALGLQDGVFHMELFRENETGRVVFSEGAVRRGGVLTQEEVLAKFNVDLGEAALLCAIGSRPELEIKVNPKQIGCTALYGPAGTVFSYPTQSEMVSQANVLFARTLAPIGSQLKTKFSMTADMMAAMLLTTDTIEEFQTRLAELRTWFGERLIVAKPSLTGTQRRRWQAEHWPERDYDDQLYNGA